MLNRSCTLLLAILLLVPATATAQTAPRPDAEIAKEIERLKREGRRMFRVNKLEDAQGKFEAALAISKLPDDELLFNLSFISWERKQCDKFMLYAAGFIYVSPGDKEIPGLRSKLVRCTKSLGNTGTLGLESIRPKSVEVRVNDVVVGRTPVYKLLVAPGRYTIKADSDPYHSYESTANVNEGIETRHRIKMRKRIYQGNLQVNTEPKGATVYLDNVKVGKGPWNRKSLDTRRYLIRVEKAGWDRWVRYVTVSKDSTERVDAVLEKTGMHVPIPPLPKQED